MSRGENERHRAVHFSMDLAMEFKRFTVIFCCRGNSRSIPTYYLEKDAQCLTKFF